MHADQSSRRCFSTAGLDFDGDWGRQYTQTVERVIPGYSALFPMALAYLKAHLSPGARVLVVGAGGGAELAAFAQEPWHITGVDPSSHMLAIARARWQQLTAQARVDLVCGEVADLPPGVSFHAATCILVMHFVPDDGTKAGFLHSIAARLKPGAPYVHVDWCDQLLDCESELAWSIVRHYLAAVGAFASDEAIGRFLDQAKQGHPVPASRMTALFADAGFVDIQRFYQAFSYGGWCMKRGVSVLG